MSKSVVKVVRLLVPAGQAKPAPPVGPALGQAGLNIVSFCKDFNSKTSDIKPGTKMAVHLRAYADKTFDYDVKMPPVSHFLLAAAGIKDGANTPGDQLVGSLSLKHIYEVAKVKSKDNPDIPLQSWCKQIIGTARSMGLKVNAQPV